MASVLPGSPPAFGRDDLPGTLRAVCGYLSTIQENAGLQISWLEEQNQTLAARVKELEQKGVV